jgi:2,3-dihydroxybenzoate-AMP ligase
LRPGERVLLQLTNHAWTVLAWYGLQMFGMGEGMCLATPLDTPPEIRHHTQGAKICALDEVRVLEPGTEQPVKTGERGELCARGPYTIRGYFRAPERNAQAFTSDGFYRTGDIVTEVRYRGESYYSLDDRIKDLISRGDEKVNAREVEELLVRHPAIERAAVVAMPDERLGERACAFLVACAGAQAPDLDEIRVFLDGLGVAKFKWPERIEVRDHLPLTNIHKVNKVALRQEIRQLLGESTEPTDF